MFLTVGAEEPKKPVDLPIIYSETKDQDILEHLSSQLCEGLFVSSTSRSRS